MILLNFAHPLTADHVAAVAGLVSDKDITIRDISAQFDLEQPFVPQVIALADACNLTSMEWQTTPIVINPPSLSAIAVALVAELHGRMGYFPPMIVLRPAGVTRPSYEVSDVINLNQVRGEARKRR